MMNRISVKIVLALIAVLAVIMVISTYLIVEQRSKVLREELLVKASSLAKIGAKALEGVLEQSLSSGQFFKEQELGRVSWRFDRKRDPKQVCRVL